MPTYKIRTHWSLSRWKKRYPLTLKCWGVKCMTMCAQLAGGEAWVYLFQSRITLSVYIMIIAWAHAGRMSAYFALHMPQFFHAFSCGAIETAVTTSLMVFAVTSALTITHSKSSISFVLCCGALDIIWEMLQRRCFAISSGKRHCRLLVSGGGGEELGRGNGSTRNLTKSMMHFLALV